MIITGCFYNLKSSQINNDDRPFKVIDLNNLANKHFENKNYYSAYLYSTSFYDLSVNDSLKYINGKIALESCINSNRLKEGLQVIRNLFNDFPDKNSELDIFYNYMLIKNRFYNEARKNILKHGYNNDQNKLFLGMSYLYSNKPDKAKKIIQAIEFKHENLVKTLNSLESKPDFNKKHPGIALTLSALIPGAGQIYTGHTFDGLVSFGYTSITAIGAYSSIMYEQSLTRKKRNYVLPVISSAAFTTFYATNLYNSFNLAKKTNKFNEAEYYKKQHDNLKEILNDKKFIKFH